RLISVSHPTAQANPMLSRLTLVSSASRPPAKMAGYAKESAPLAAVRCRSDGNAGSVGALALHGIERSRKHAPGWRIDPDRRCRRLPSHRCVPWKSRVADCGYLVDVSDDLRRVRPITSSTPSVGIQHTWGKVRYRMQSIDGCYTLGQGPTETR